MDEELPMPTGTAGVYSVAEIGRNLSDIKAELREQRGQAAHMNEKVTAIPTQLALMEERQTNLLRRVDDLEKRQESREAGEAASRKWLIASIVMPVVMLISSPIVALIIAGSLK